MKKLIFIFIALLCLNSCYTEDDKMNLQKECIELQQKKANLLHQIDNTRRILKDYHKEVNDIQVEKRAFENGHEPKYIIKVKIKQGTFTLDPFEHIKNEANAMEMELPVSREFYNNTTVGTDLLDELKIGSFFIDGDISWLHFKIVEKRIEYK